MDLKAAFQACREGNFVSHFIFDDYESIHEYNGEFYTEEGFNLSYDEDDDTPIIKLLEKANWAQEDWYIKYPKEQVNRSLLIQMHEENKDNDWLPESTYDVCIQKK